MILLIYCLQNDTFSEMNWFCKTIEIFQTLSAIYREKYFWYEICLKDDGRAGTMFLVGAF